MRKCTPFYFRCFGVLFPVYVHQGTNKGWKRNNTTKRAKMQYFLQRFVCKKYISAETPQRPHGAPK